MEKLRVQQQWNTLCGCSYFFIKYLISVRGACSVLFTSSVRGCFFFISSEPGCLSLKCSVPRCSFLPPWLVKKWKKHIAIEINRRSNGVSSTVETCLPKYFHLNLPSLNDNLCSTRLQLINHPFFQSRQKWSTRQPKAVRSSCTVLVSTKVPKLGFCSLPWLWLLIAGFQKNVWLKFGIIWYYNDVDFVQAHLYFLLEDGSIKLF